jgi:hypothetical protein
MIRQLFSLGIVTLLILIGVSEQASAYSRDEIPAPEPIFQPDDCLVPEVVTIKIENRSQGSRSITSFQIKNICERDVSHKIFFDGGYDTCDDHFSFGWLETILINGVKVQTQKEEKAIIDGKDVTSLLKSMGMDIEAPEDWAFLEKNRQELITYYHLDDQKFKNFVTQNFAPIWNIVYTYWIDQMFLAQSTTTLQYEVSLHRGSKLSEEALSACHEQENISYNKRIMCIQKILEQNSMNLCFDANMIIQELNSTYGDQYYHYLIQYSNSIFLSAAKWKHPIGNLNIEYISNVSKQFGNELIISCIDGKHHIATDTIKGNRSRGLEKV